MYIFSSFVCAKFQTDCLKTVRGVDYSIATQSKKSYAHLQYACNIRQYTISSRLVGRVITNLLSTPMGIDNVVIGLDMEVQPLVTHNAA